MAGAPKSQVLNLANLVAYQEGSIVSRQITQAETGNVTLFAFAEGQELSEHSAPFDALVHILEGSAEIRLSGRPFELEAGEAIILPAGEPHVLRAVKPFKMLLTMIPSVS